MSNRPGPPIGRHCPLKSGYFVSSHACVSAIEAHSAATSAVAASEPRYIMAILPCDHGPCRRSKAQDELVSLLLHATYMIRVQAGRSPSYFDHLVGVAPARSVRCR